MSINYIKCKHIDSGEEKYIEVGFSIFAFFFPIFWLLFYRFWVLSIIPIIAQFFLFVSLFDLLPSFISSSVRSDMDVLLVVLYSSMTVYLFSSIYLGINGYKLRLSKSAKQGYQLEGMVTYYQILKNTEK